MLGKKIARLSKVQLRRRLNQITSSISGLTGQFENPIWLIGEGRSGTTWASSIINYDKKMMEVFEPFHPNFGPSSKLFNAHQYIRPGSESPLDSFSERVFKGRYISPRQESDRIGWRHKGLLIKDIFSNLMARWAFERHPNLRIVLLVRNPFAVALSKSKTKDWHWMSNPTAFLDQENLMSDYLEPFRGLISGIGEDYILRQILIWSIVHYVPLRQFSRDQIYVQFYENLFEDPHGEIERLMAFLHGPDGAYQVPSALTAVPRLSDVAGDDSMVALGKSPVSGWLYEVSPHQRAAGQKILEEFQLDGVYGDDGRSNPNGIDALFGH